MTNAQTNLPTRLAFTNTSLPGRHLVLQAFVHAAALGTLVEELGAPQPTIACEIRGPCSIPQVGSMSHTFHMWDHGKPSTLSLIRRKI